MSIDTQVKGEPADVHDVASWMRGERSDSLLEGHQLASMAWAVSADGWQGATGDAYRGASATLGEASDVYVRLLEQAAGAIDDYGEQLRSLKDYMGTLRDFAQGEGLVVDGYDIQPPDRGAILVAVLPEEGTPERAELDARTEEFYHRQQVYESLEVKVDEARTLFTEWIGCNLEPKVEFVGGEDLLTWKGKLPTPARLGVGLGENLVSAGAGTLRDLPEDAARVGSAATKLTQGAYDSARDGSAEPLVEAGLSVAGSEGVALLESGGRKSPWALLGQAAVSTGVDEAASAGAGAIVGEEARDPDDYLGPRPRAPYEPAPFLPGSDTGDDREYTRPRGSRGR